MNIMYVIIVVGAVVTAALTSDIQVETHKIKDQHGKEHEYMNKPRVGDDNFCVKHLVHENIQIKK